ncbi:right-handed parallel beta-helix repeat-containing protein [bacterium]|nr:MAG: right-handed parallel beta-helix repeat-containing protein [bacterium]
MKLGNTWRAVLTIGASLASSSVGIDRASYAATKPQPQKATTQTLYIATNGNDHWSGKLAQPNKGRTDGPFATLEGARNAIRVLKAKRGLSAPIKVIVASGIYRRHQTFVLQPQDSGTPTAPITYQGADGARPIFSGGRVISGWKRGLNGIWEAQIPDVKAGAWYFEQLWVNGKRATRARTPNNFYLYAAGKARPANDLTNGDPATINERAFRANPADVAPLLHLSQRELNDVTVRAYQSWEAARLRVAAVEPKTSTVSMTGATLWGFFSFHSFQRYEMENFKAALDEPGEWFLSRSGTLYYKPLPGEDMAKAQVTAPVLETAVAVRGEPEKGRWVENVTFKNLSFQHSQYILPANGLSDTQAAISIPATVMIDGARRLKLEDCEIAHTGTYGVWLRRGCHNDQLIRNHIHDLGAGGVRVGETEIRANDSEGTNHITLDNNIIQSGGLIHRGAIGVWVGQSGDNAITHNDIGDFYYTGVSVGWRWGYDTSLAKRNTIGFNHIHHIGSGVMGDLGGVYTLGPSEGTTISNNRIHDVYCFANGGWGLYNDEGTVGVVMENNLVYDNSGNYHQHYGKENIIRNNIFAFATETEAQRTKLENHLAFTFENNIVDWTKGLALRGNWAKNVTIRNNLYFDQSKQPTPFNGMNFAAWQATGQDAGSKIADPLFVDAAKRDFRLRPNSPALSMGFRPFDYSRAGVYGNAAWVRLAAMSATPKLVLPPPPPTPSRLTLADGFEDTPTTHKPVEADVKVANGGDSISITDETAASGKHSLKIVDAPNLPAAFYPFLYYSPHHKSGMTRCSFDLRYEAGANIYHEWRDGAEPYNVGPRLDIRDGKLSAAGRELMDMPVGRWAHFELVAGLVNKAADKWDLTVTLAGEQPRRFTNLPYITPGWKSLDWLGFVSMATDTSVYYLDNFDLSNAP